jgi:hypothetical protein
MPRYFYDIAGDHPFLHEEGVEHPDDKAAWREAMRLMRDVEETLRPYGRWALTVRQGKRVVYLIDLSAKTVIEDVLRSQAPSSARALRPGLVSPSAAYWPRLF